MDTAPKLHPGIIALDERIRVVRQSLAPRSEASFSELEDKLVAEIAVLRERLETLRRQRDEAKTAVVTRMAELKDLEKLRETCLADDRVATAVWMKLLTQRNTR